MGPGGPRVRSGTGPRRAARAHVGRQGDGFVGGERRGRSTAELHLAHQELGEVEADRLEAEEAEVDQCDVRGIRVDQKVVGAGITVQASGGMASSSTTTSGSCAAAAWRAARWEKAAAMRVVGKPVVHQRRHDLMPKASLDVLAHRCHPVARLLGDGAHATGSRQTARAGMPRAPVARSSTGHRGSSPRPARSRPNPGRDPTREGHGAWSAPRGGPVPGAGPVDAGFVGPGEGGIEGGTVFLGDHGGMDGGGKALDVLDRRRRRKSRGPRGVERVRAPSADRLWSACRQRVGVRRRDRGEQLHLLG